MSDININSLQGRIRDLATSLDGNRYAVSEGILNADDLLDEIPAGIAKKVQRAGYTDLNSAVNALKSLGVSVQLNGNIYRALEALYAFNAGRQVVREMCDARDFTVSLLSRNRGVFIGETHEVTPENAAFMVDGLADFKAAGVKILALEAVCSDDQILIDNYYSDPLQGKAVLENYTDQRLGLFSLIEAARQVGIRVIGIDMKARAYGSSNYDPKLAMPEINQWWAKIVTQELMKFPPDTKYLVYGGYLHSSAIGEGINNYLHIPSIVPMDLNDHPKPVFALYAGVKIIPGVAWDAEYQRAYVQSFNGFCEKSVQYYTQSKNAPAIAEKYAELNQYIAIYLKNPDNFANKRQIQNTITILLAQVEEYDVEYLQQIAKDIR